MRANLTPKRGLGERPTYTEADEEAHMSKFIEMFRQSPFQPLREHMTEVMECVGLVRPMFEAVRDGRHEALAQTTKEVFKKEHDADIIKDEIRQTIPKTFYLPVFRGDLLGHLKLQDDMADAAEDVAFLLTVKQLRLPQALNGKVMEYVDTVIRVCELANALAGQLQDVVEQGFPPAVVDEALAAVKAVEKAEWESDRSQYKLTQALFALESEVSPIDIMLWFKIFGELGQLANHAESLADRVRRMLTSR